jgi:hypothetical protein
MALTFKCVVCDDVIENPMAWQFHCNRDRCKKIYHHYSCWRSKQRFLEKLINLERLTNNMKKKCKHKFISAYRVSTGKKIKICYYCDKVK